MNTIKSIKTADGEYQIDYNGLANLPEANTNIEGFLPHGTIIKVELDGSGDFTSVEEAIIFLRQKFSNGTITIQLGEGTFKSDKQIQIYGNTYNFAKLIIEGKGIDKTIFSSSANGATEGAFGIDNCPIPIIFKNFTISREEATVSDKRCIRSMGPENCVTLENMHLTSALQGLTNSYGSTAHVKNVTCSNITGYALNAVGGGRTIISWGITVNFKNCNVGLYVHNGGDIIMHDCNYTATNVTTLTSQAIGTVNNEGSIRGRWTKI